MLSKKAVLLKLKSYQFDIVDYKNDVALRKQIEFKM